MVAGFRERLLQCAGTDGGDIGEGAIWIACEDLPGVDDAPLFALLDSMGAEARERLLDSGYQVDDDEHRKTNDPIAIIDILRSVIWEKVHLHGAGGGNPKTHYINTVLEQGAGIPIACCAIWMSVGKRANVPVEGVGLPGHFVVRVSGQLVDAFGGGEVLGENGARRIIGKALGSLPATLSPAWLMATGTRTMLARMSRNLRGCYSLRENWEMALRCADRCVSLVPEDPSERRDRGLLHWKIGHSTRALDDLRYYLDHADPTAADLRVMEDVVARIRSNLN